MKRKKSVLRLLVIESTISLSVPLLFITFYVGTFGLGAVTAFSHFYALSPLLLTLFGLRFIAAALFSMWRQVEVIVEALIVSLFASAVLLYYALCLLALTNWGEVITLEIMKAFSGAQFPILLRTVGLSPIAFALVSFAGFAVLVCTVYFVVKRFSIAHQASVNLGSGWCLFLGLSSLVGALGLGLRISNHPPGDGVEPIAVTFFNEHFEARLQSARLNGFAVALRGKKHAAAADNYSPSDMIPEKNIFVFHVDGLRADRLSSLGYFRNTSPNLKEFAERGRFSHLGWLYSTCSESACGLAGLEGSQYADSIGGDLFSLSDVLQAHGYRRYYLLSGEHKVWHGLTDLYGENGVVLDGSDFPDYPTNSDEVLFEMLDGVVFDGQGPVFVQFHLMSAHQLGFRFLDEQPFQPAKQYAFPLLRGSRVETDNYYDNGVYQTDHVIGELLAELEDRGFLNDAVVAIVSDHGESLGEGGIWGHSRGVSPSEVVVPVLFSSDWSASFDQPIEIKKGSSVDFAPTIAQAAGLPIPEIWRGLSLDRYDQDRIIRITQDKHRSVILTSSNETMEILCDINAAEVSVYFVGEFGGRQRANLDHEFLTEILGEKVSEVRRFFSPFCEIEA